MEDHDAVRRALRERLQASFSRFRLREAGTVDEALKIVETEKVDLVLMDFRLPGKDGVHGTRLVLERSPHGLRGLVVAVLRDDGRDLPGPLGGR